MMECLSCGCLSVACCACGNAGLGCLSTALLLCTAALAVDQDVRRGGEGLVGLAVGPSWRPLLLASAMACLAKLDAV